MRKDLLIEKISDLELIFVISAQNSVIEWMKEFYVEEG
jgi:hypothetical protein